LTATEPGAQDARTTYIILYMTGSWVAPYPGGQMLPRQCLTTARLPAGRLSRRTFVGRVAVLTIALVTGCQLVRQSQPKRIATARVGVFTAGGQEADQGNFQAFLDRAKQLGWVQGDNLVLDVRWGNGQRDAVPNIAREFASLPVDVIVAAGTVSAQAAKAATSTIPIVMTGLASDPVANGLVASLARPGGNVTGLGSLDAVLSGKRIELLTDLVPGLKRVCAFSTPANPSLPQNLSDSQTAADQIGLQIQLIDVDVADLPAAFESARAWNAEAAIVFGDAVLQQIIPAFVQLIRASKLPSIYNQSAWVLAGGLIYCGTDVKSQWAGAADYMDKILRGARPADLPIEQPTVFEIGINVHAVKELGLAIPADVASQVTSWLSS
jgi:putative tryptophan/tyrosine transport system substrate-binding protein